MATTHTLTVPCLAGVERWEFLPLHEDDPHQHFNRLSGQWRDRGYKKGDVVAKLRNVKADGSGGFIGTEIRAPADGYINLPPRKCYVKPGENFGTFTEGYVYHYRFFGTKEENQRLRRRQVAYRRCPRYRQFVYMNRSIAVCLAASALMWLTEWSFFGFVIFWSAVAMVGFATQLVFGPQRVKDWHDRLCDKQAALFAWIGSKLCFRRS